MKKIIITILLLGVALGILAVGFLYRYVAAEGYPTVEAMRNRLLSDGKIVIGLPPGFRSVTDVSCDDASGEDIEIHEDRVVVHVGYTWCTTKIKGTTSDDREAVIVVNSQKLNSWNTIRYVPLSPVSNNWVWAKYENGVLEEHTDIKAEYRLANRVPGSD